jgi:hypothetical protein
MAGAVQHSLPTGHLDMICSNKVTAHSLDHVEQSREVTRCRYIVPVEKAQIATLGRGKARISGG